MKDQSSSDKYVNCDVLKTGQFLTAYTDQTEKVHVQASDSKGHHQPSAK
ncbi:hypothetical protein Bache_1871 [Bacteroides helcogenes P 36-108]|uniref:Uncharacterized protein n=1 Tax=Bacteroides helcogenes (strain ATCC 35417 / DSM 20613 / JCM 6297 / CCUG 15421 / P 36-108) TaxID=693979 RepID=E6SPK8_BACT6|nr:hypothetical protein Bache_1871 [Bacteroides helcogenes P 36-108]